MKNIELIILVGIFIIIAYYGWKNLREEKSAKKLEGPEDK